MVSAVAPSDGAVMSPTVHAVTAVAGSVADPELPNLTIADLGILRDVRISADGHVEVDLTPTYSGCPAVEVIEQDVRAALAGAGWQDVAVRRLLAPAWTTDWITAAGRQKLRASGIAPPGPVCRGVPGGAAAAPPSRAIGFVRCPQCGSRDTEILSRFSSTACKALRRCRGCWEPFEHFKPL